MEYLGRTELVQVPPSESRRPEAPARLTEPDDALEPPNTAPRVPPAARVSARPAQHVAGANGAGPESVRMQSRGVTEQLAHVSKDAPFCDSCGHLTVRNAACYKCVNCGNSLGCS